MGISKQHLQWVLVVIPVFGVFAWTALRPFVSAGAHQQVATARPAPLSHSVMELDGWFDSYWRSHNVAPADAADELLIFRRLTLALHGSVPSLEEIRDFEADTQDNRLTTGSNKILKDLRPSMHRRD